MSDDVYELYAIRYATNPRRRRVENLMWVAPDDPHDAPMPMDFKHGPSCLVCRGALQLE